MAKALLAQKLMPNKLDLLSAFRTGGDHVIKEMEKTVRTWNNTFPIFMGELQTWVIDAAVGPTAEDQVYLSIGNCEWCQICGEARARSYVRGQYNGADILTVAATWVTIPWDVVIADTQGEYNPATGEFTANADKCIMLQADIVSIRQLLDQFNGGLPTPETTNWVLGVFLNGAFHQAFARQDIYQDGVTPSSPTLASSIPMRLDAGDVVDIRIITDLADGFVAIRANPLGNFFNIIEFDCGID